MLSEKRTTVGIDLALRSQHKAAYIVSDEGRVHRLKPFGTSVKDLSAMVEEVRSRVGGEGTIEFIMEPTSHAWYPVAQWLVSQGHPVYLIRPEKVSDLRKYLSKYTKTDRIDAATQAQIGQFDRENLFPVRLHTAEERACFRLCKQRALHSATVGSIKTRIRDSAELAVPGLSAVLGELFNQMGRKLLREHMHPHRTASLGLKRFSRMCQKAHHGSIAQEDLEKIFQAYVDASRLYRRTDREEDLDMDFETLQLEIANDLAHLEFLEVQIEQLDSKIEALYEKIDPRKVLTSIQGIGPVIGAALTSKIGNINDFKNISALKSHCGMVSRTKQTSNTDRKGLRITKAANRYLKQYLYMAAETARHWDPEFAQFYVRLAYGKKKHHKEVIVALANKMSGRVYAVLKRVANNPASNDVFYQLRDLEGRPITKVQARELALEILRKGKEERSTEAA